MAAFLGILLNRYVSITSQYTSMNTHSCCVYFCYYDYFLFCNLKYWFCFRHFYVLITFFTLISIFIITLLFQFLCFSSIIIFIKTTLQRGRDTFLQLFLLMEWKARLPFIRDDLRLRRRHLIKETKTCHSASFSNSIKHACLLNEC